MIYLIRGCLAFFLLMAALPLSAGRQEKNNGDILMVGRCYTPAESAEVLDRFALTHQDRASWESRRTLIRQGILEGAKLAPLPDDRGMMRIIRHSKKQMVGYTVENVAIESVSGFWLCGNLYLPDGFDPETDDAIPGVLCPHGHKKDKRFDEQVQARSASFARLGCAVFAYDMIGHGETKQLDHKIKQAFRFQTYNSIRALDFLSSLTGIDNDRLAITGGSGGGTQAFILSAIDGRIDLSMPAVMVSAHFFGGCVCESGMPIHVRGDFETNNVEIAASFAPKPLLLISNGKDWTADNPTIAMPYVQRVYGYYNATDRVENAHLESEGHDYGPSKRAAAYRFLAKHFKLDLAGIQNGEGEIDESWFKLLDPKELRVFNEANPMPADAIQTPAELSERLDAIIKRD